MRLQRTCHTRVHHLTLGKVHSNLGLGSIFIPSICFFLLSFPSLNPISPSWNRGKNVGGKVTTNVYYSSKCSRSLSTALVSAPALAMGESKYLTSNS